MKRQLSGAANEREKQKLKKLGELSFPKICKLAKNLENVLLGETKCWSCHYKKCQKNARKQYLEQLQIHSVSNCLILQEQISLLKNLGRMSGITKITE